MRVLVTGAEGQLGRELQRAAPATFEVTALGRGGLDLRDPAASARALARCRPRLVINAAAFTGVDEAETRRDEAFAVNSEGAARLAAAARESGARLLHLSTDFVFDGAAERPYRPDDPPRPLGVYGASKLEGEERVLEATGGGALVVRTSWLYSRFGRNFVLAVLRRLHDREPLRVVRDQVGSPTWANGLARALWRLAAAEQACGVLHWADAGAVSRHELALAIREEAGRLDLADPEVPVEPIATSELGAAAPRPRYSALDTTLAARILGCDPEPWRTALGRMLAEAGEALRG